MIFLNDFHHIYNLKMSKILLLLGRFLLALSLISSAYQHYINPNKGVS